MTDNVTKALLPCPFCGKAAEYVCENDHHGDYFRLGCPDEECAAHWTFYTEPQEISAECIKRWNTRLAAQSAGDVATANVLAQTLLDEDYQDCDSHELAAIVLKHWDVRWKSAKPGGQ